MDQLGVSLNYRKAQNLACWKAMTALQLQLVVVTQVQWGIAIRFPILEFDLICLACRVGQVQLADQQGGTISHSGCATLAMPATLSCSYGCHPQC